MDKILATVQEDIHYHFQQVKLLTLALAHSSWANEQGCPGESNERLEFLGDAVLELCVTQEVYRRYPEADEGLLTKVRSRLVKTGTLAEVARQLKLERSLCLGRGEESQGGRDRDGLLADSLEAVFGAVFLDGGFDAARELVLRLLGPRFPENATAPPAKDYKTRLQEVTQETHRERPQYVLAESTGPEHSKVFAVEVVLPGGERYRGEGGSLKKAEQAAAALALSVLRPHSAP